MKRYLRIAVSVFFTLVAVALCVLWVRSYWWCDFINGDYHDYGVEFGSKVGKIGGQVWIFETPHPARFAWGKFPLTPKEQWLPSTFRYFALGFVGQIGATKVMLFVPQWFALFVTLALAASPWVRFSNRFSLRTILIATTLVAVVLGVGAWLVR